MNVATVLAILLCAALVGAGFPKVLALRPMVESAEHLGFSVGAYRLIGTAELLAAIGVLVGLEVKLIGCLSDLGIIALLAGAVISHRRADDRLPTLLPAIGVMALAVAQGIALALR